MSLESKRLFKTTLYIIFRTKLTETYSFNATKHYFYIDIKIHLIKYPQLKYPY